MHIPLYVTQTKPDKFALLQLPDKNGIYLAYHLFNPPPSMVLLPMFVHDVQKYARRNLLVHPSEPTCLEVSRQFGRYLDEETQNVLGWVG